MVQIRQLAAPSSPLSALGRDASLLNLAWIESASSSAPSKTHSEFRAKPCCLRFWNGSCLGGGPKTIQRGQTDVLIDEEVHGRIALGV